MLSIVDSVKSDLDRYKNLSETAESIPTRERMMKKIKASLILHQLYLGLAHAPGNPSTLTASTWHARMHASK